jgi:hypothetical protein
VRRIQFFVSVRFNGKVGKAGDGVSGYPSWLCVVDLNMMFEIV